MWYPYRLNYFNPIACTIIDPMHNLFLGTAKRMAKMWIRLNDLNSDDLQQMQQIANTIVLPPDYVSLKRKIQSGFSFMTADDWKSSVLVYSPVVLQGRLPQPKLVHWLRFVNACRLLIRPSLTEDDLTLAHEHMVAFCQDVQVLYEEQEVTPNMHLHVHMKETIENFSSPYGF